MRKSATAAGGSVIVAFTLLTVAAYRPDAPTKAMLVQQSAEVWAKTDKAAIPKDFESYAALSQPYRKAAYRYLSWSTRESLWRTHLESFVLPTDSLSPEQRETVARIGRVLTSEQKQFVRLWIDSVVARGYKPDWTIEQRQALVKPFCQKAHALFGAQTTYDIFGLIGPIDVSYRNLLRSEALPHIDQAALFDITPAKNLLRKALAKAGLYQVGNCNCNVSSACDCGGGQYCVGSQCSGWIGCGCGGYFTCNGNQCAQG